MLLLRFPGPASPLQQAAELAGGSYPQVTCHKGVNELSGDLRKAGRSGAIKRAYAPRSNQPIKQAMTRPHAPTQAKMTKISTTRPTICIAVLSGAIGGAKGGGGEPGGCDGGIGGSGSGGTGISH